MNFDPETDYLFGRKTFKIRQCGTLRVICVFASSREIEASKSI